MAGVWVQFWEEDGCWLYPSYEAAVIDTGEMLKKMRTAEAMGAVPDEYSRPCGEPQYKEVSPDLAAEVSQKGRVFQPRFTANA